MNIFWVACAAFAAGFYIGMGLMCVFFVAKNYPEGGNNDKA